MNDIDLTQGSIFSHIRRIAIPASVGMLFNTLFNVVDTYYAGKLSTESLAGMTISFPIFFIILALSSGIGSGATALSAIALGEKDQEKFHSLSYNAILFGFCLSLLISLFAPLIVPYLFNLSGASGLSKTLGIQYTNTIFYGSVFFILNSVLNAMLNAQGDTKSYRNFLIIGFFMNLFLDPLFIFGWFGLPKLGTTGVALATVIVQAIGSVYMISRLKKSPIFKLSRFKAERFKPQVVLQLFQQGFPASLNMMTIALGVFVINFFVLKYAGSVTIAAYGVAVRVEQLVLLPALGLNIAALTLSGQNYGAKLYQRILETQRTALYIGVGMMIVGAFLIYPLAPYVIALFNDNDGVIMAGTHYLRIEVFALPTYIILNVLISVLQGIKKPNFAVLIGLYRQILIPSTLFYFLGNVMGMGITGVWWGIVINNWSAVIIALIYTRFAMKRLKKDLEG